MGGQETARAKPTAKRVSTVICCLGILFSLSNCTSLVGQHIHGKPPTYHHLLIVYTNTDIDYLKDGSSLHFTGSLTNVLKTAVTNAFRGLPKLIYQGSGNVVLSTYDIVEISRPIKQATLSGGAYYISSKNIQSDLDSLAPKGKYDSVHAIWFSGPLPANWGEGGVFINGGASTFSTLIAGEAWWWTSGQAPGEPFLHEWLHGVCNFYSGLGYIMPKANADGASLHGYSHSDREGWMSYYRDLMQGKVLEPALGKFTGIPKEAWYRGTPTSHE